MTRTTTIAALLLLVGPASAQDPGVQPLPEDPNAPAIPVTEQVPQPLPTLVGTSALPVAPETEPTPEAEAAPEQPPPRTDLPIGTLDPKVALDAPPTIVTQPVPRPSAPALTLTVDRAVAPRGEPFIFTVSSAVMKPDQLARAALQVTITRQEKVFRTLRVARNGKARTVLPLGNYQAHAFVTRSLDTYVAARSLLPTFSNRLSLRVVDPRADAPAETPAPQPEPQKPAVTGPVPEAKPAPVVRPLSPEPRARTAERSTWPWLLIAIAAVALLALGGTVKRIRARTPKAEQRSRDESDGAPKAPRLTSKAHVTHQTTLLTAPRLRFRISARAVPDKGKQHILPPSTPAPKLEDAHDRRADRP